jgi:hypothetical protein
LQVKHFRPGVERDEYGRLRDTWDDPEDWMVYGYAPGANVEPERAGRDLSEVLWTVYAPAEGLPGERDRVVLEGAEYSVEGRPQDFSHDPWGNAVGEGVVFLKAVSG